MDKEKKILITGAAGFIASCLVAGLNEQGFDQLILADDFSRKDKQANLAGKAFLQQLDREDLPQWLEMHAEEIGFIFHYGARTDTTETDVALFNRLNLHYSQKLWSIAAQKRIPMVYASSAATYGLGEHTYADDHRLIPVLSPLNAYGRSKQDFDHWVLGQAVKPPFWAGLKFFNVYGPNEYHKGRMASVVFHAYAQIQQSGQVRLFRSHRPDYKDGEQVRDFVYVRDVVAVSIWLMQHQPASAIYNLGSGRARSFLDLARAVYKASGREEQIDFVDTPEDIRDKYQYFTEASMEKLRKAGYTHSFHSLESGIEDYVDRFLSKERHW
jgi:ADP-L-glycero-D-manno-heptose 6-epimerase